MTYANLTSRCASEPRIYNSNTPGELQICIGDLTLFMSIDGWRVLNATVEQHIADHPTDQPAAAAS
jgi:hypothetical protein